MRWAETSNWSEHFIHMSYHSGFCIVYKQHKCPLKGTNITNIYDFLWLEFAYILFNYWKMYLIMCVLAIVRRYVIIMNISF